MLRDLRPLCGTWRPGELAVCILDSWDEPSPVNPRVGDVLRVTAVIEGAKNDVLVVALHFEGKPHEDAWCGAHFRKIVRDNRPAEESFTFLLKRGARSPQLEDA